MPLYTVQCQCGHRKDVFRKVSERDDALPEHCGSPMVRAITAPYIAPDIQPYQAVAVDVATGKPPVINSRSSHRAFLKRNGYVEVGNDMPKRPVPEVRGDFNLRGDLTDATRQVLRGAK
ncbi:hypothetical protein WM40_22655 [Robbsia andropogonis]|uniref:Putative regulatory protein FmdB zinc ribbon domain-containing protein n=1 Tax=Robbsia andropogonis TaxID=28092 RepID=A0A0F5JV98_9BURK|nr:zinc ribbon domain-containing protein [Robbsia andropogonis]KKB61544.1 hypothetical protein WM40_22655 [Robbsia andropogonis]